jgi:hypothetical protein
LTKTLVRMYKMVNYETTLLYWNKINQYCLKNIYHTFASNIVTKLQNRLIEINKTFFIKYFLILKKLVKLYKFIKFNNILLRKVIQTFWDYFNCYFSKKYHDLYMYRIAFASIKLFSMIMQMFSLKLQPTFDILSIGLIRKFGDYQRVQFRRFSLHHLHLVILRLNLLSNKSVESFYFNHVHRCWYIFHCCFRSATEIVIIRHLKYHHRFTLKIWFI